MATKERIWNVPNILSMIRILLVPIVAVLIGYDNMVPALILFLVACATDLLDGQIARKNGLITKVGMWLDPLADKLMAVTVVIMFTVKGIIPLFVVIVLLSKELLMIIGGAVLIKKGINVPANKFGKIASFLLNVSIASGFLYQVFTPYYLYAIYVALGLMVIALIQYAYINIVRRLLFKRITKKAREEVDE